MADRKVSVKLEGDSRSYVSAANRAADATDNLRNKAERFAGKNYYAHLGVNGTAAAEANLERIRRGLAEVDGKHAQARVSVTTQPASRDVALLTNAIASLGPGAVAAAGAAGGALLALGSTLGTVAAAGAVTALAFNGVFDALDKVQKADADPTAAKVKNARLAMEELTESGRHLVRFLDDLDPQLRSIQAAAQAGLLPGVERGITSLMTMLPEVRGLIGETATQLGNLAAEGGKALSSPFWREYVDFLKINMGPTLTSLGRIIGGLVEGLAGVQMAFNPLAQDLLRGLGDLAQRFATWGEGLSRNRDFQEFVAYVRDTGPAVLDTIGSIASALTEIVVAAAPLGGPVLAIVGTFADVLGAIAASPAGTTLIAVAGGLGAVGMALRLVDVATTSRLLGFFTGLPAAMSAGALNAGVFTERMTGSAKAGERVASAGDKLGTSLGKLGTALPIVGVAAIGVGLGYDELKRKTDTFASSVLSGSMNMQDAINAERNSLEKRNWWMSTAEDGMDLEVLARQRVIAEMDKQIAAASGVERASLQAAREQAVYDQAVKDFGAYSPQAIGAQQALTVATNAEKDARRQAADATRDQAGALRDLQNDQMAALDAELGLKQALQSRKEAQEAATVATRDHGKGSDEAAAANLRLEQADAAVIRASDQLSAANLVNAASADQSRIAAFNHDNTLLGLASGINGKASPAIVDMAAKMTDSALQAHNAMVETSGMDHTVRTLPDGRTVKIATDSAVRETENVATLHGKIDGLPPITQLALKVVGVDVSAADVKWEDGRASSYGYNSGGGYATGGYVRGPGTTTSDDINARLSDKEYVVKASATQSLGVGTLDYINRTGQLPAFAEGGIYRSSEFPALIDNVRDRIFGNAAKKAGQMVYEQMFMGGGNGLAWAQGEAGKLYGWGAVGPSSYDCSGFMAAIMNVMDGMSPYRRRGTTATFPWPGMEPGMGPGLSVGNTRSVNGGAGHMAGTINGVNVESRGGDGVVIGKRARGARDDLFNSIYHYRGRGEFAAGGSGAIEGGGLARQQVQAVANRYGWGGGPQWNALNALIGKESTWDPNARNPTSSAAGLFQKMQSIWGAVEQTPGGQAEWGLKYIKGRYGSPSAAWAFHQGHNYYDEGGLATGKGYMAKNTIAPERVLSPRTTVAFEQLVDVLARPRPVSYVPSAGAGGAGAASATGPKVQFGDVHLAQPVDIDLLSSRLEFAVSSASF